MSTESNDEWPEWAFVLLYVGGGLSTGFGILYLYWSFGWPEGDFNGNFAKIGSTGLDNITLLDASNYSIPMVVAGVLALILANAVSWRKTNGY